MNKGQLEIKKLRLEISELGRPWYKKPAYIFPAIVVIGTLLTGFITQFFQAEFTKFENQKHDLQSDNEALATRRDDLNKKVAALLSDQDKLTAQSHELASRTREVTAQTSQVTIQRKQLIAEKLRLSREQAELETAYGEKQQALQREFGKRTADYELKSAELSKQYEARKNEIDTKIADIQQRLVVAPVASLLQELRNDSPFQLSFNYKPDELVRLLMQSEEERPARLRLVEDSLLDGGEGPLFKGKLLYVMFSVTRDEKWKDQFVALIQTDPTKIPTTFSSVLKARGWNPKVEFSGSLDTMVGETNGMPEMCELAIMILRASPPTPRHKALAGEAPQATKEETTKLEREITKEAKEIDLYGRSSMLGPCESLSKPIEGVNEFHDPQLLLTGITMSRDLALQGPDTFRLGALSALYNFSRPAAYVVSMKLLTQFPHSKPVAENTVIFPSWRDKVAEIGREAEQATGSRGPKEKTIHPSKWLRANRDLVKLWMEEDLRTLRSAPSSVRLSLKPQSN